MNWIKRLFKRHAQAHGPIISLHREAHAKGTPGCGFPWRSIMNGHVTCQLHHANRHWWFAEGDPPKSYSWVAIGSERSVP